MYLAHRIARAHLVRMGSSIDDTRDAVHYESRDAAAFFRESWPWSFDGAQEVERAVLESRAWGRCELRFSPTGGLPF